MGEFFLCEKRDLEEGAKELEVEGRRIIVLKKGEKIYAFGAECTHAGAPLLKGAVCGNTVVCPWHHAIFDLDTGLPLEPPALEPVPALRVFEREGKVYGEWVRVEATAEPRGHGELYLVVGLGAAGLAAVKTLREKGFRGRIVAVSADKDLPYSRPLLTKGFLSGRVHRDDLYIYNREFYERLGVELILGRIVTELDAGSNTAVLDDGREIQFDRALVATGGRPRKLRVPGVELEGVFTLRSLEDAVKLREWLTGKRKVVVVGASFIGVEVASELSSAGFEVTLIGIESAPLELSLGREVASRIARIVEGHGVRLLMGEKVAAFDGRGRVERVVLSSGSELAADAVVLGVGIEPLSGFVVGVKKTEEGKIVVDERMHAGGDVYAAGDVVAFPYRGELVSVEHWRVAQQQGIVAAYNMLGLDKVYDGVPFFWTSLFGTSLRYVGYARRWSDVVVEGEGTRFMAFYLKGDEVLSVAGTGFDRELAAAEVAMLRSGALTVEELKRRISECLK